MHEVHCPVPTFAENFPAAQFKQGPSEFESLNFPTSHGTHRSSMDVPEKPTLHTQSVISSLPAEEVESMRTDPQDMHSSFVDPADVENFPAPQSVQGPSDSDSLNLPALHAVHSPPETDLVNPALQTQSETSSDPRGEVELEGHKEVTLFPPQQ